MITLRGTKYRLLRWLAMLTVSAALSAYLILSGHYEWLIVSVSVAALSVYRILRMFSENIRKMTFMFDAVANGDYTFRFTEYDGTLADNLLNITLNRMRDVLVREKEEVARKERYYSLILNSVNTGILVIDDRGSVYQTNIEARRQLGLPILTHIGQLSRVDESLPTLFRELHTGEKRQIRFSNEWGETTLSVRCSSIEQGDSELRIMALNEIGNELAEQEVESWIRLIRLLTHEIMNSVTPMISLSATLREMTDPDHSQMREGLETICATGKGLTAFINSYRELTRIPVPHASAFAVKPFLRRAVNLMRQEFPEVSSTLSVEPDDLILWADETLIFQVITNLLRNAAQALDGIPGGEITITAGLQTTDNPIIRICDNGSGIPAEILPNIFIPFFTTKEHGYGIGLSLSRQIMRLHGGQLTVVSHPGETVFNLLFTGELSADTL